MYEVEVPKPLLQLYVYAGIPPLLLARLMVVDAPLQSVAVPVVIGFIGT